MEGPVRKVLYEKRYHASRPFTPTYPPLPQVNREASAGGLLSYFPFPGVNQLREKWSGYRSPKRLKKPISLLVSPRGERVAVAAGNHVTILQKEDDYKEPLGTFTSSSLGSFTSGAWSESHDILGLCDDNDTLFFIKASGEEITRITKRHLKVSSSILSLIVHDDNDSHRSLLCSFVFLTTDGCLYNIEVSPEPRASVPTRHALNSDLAAKIKFPHKVYCSDYSPELSLLAIVGSESSGSPHLSVWRKCPNSGLEPLSSAQFEGLYCEPKGDAAKLTYPKVLISPHCRYVASLDMSGHLHVFELDKETCTITNAKGCSEEIIEFAWWSDHILTLVKRSGTISMFSILLNLNIQDDNPVYTAPVLERVHKYEGHLLLLETSSSARRPDPSNHDRETSDIDQTEDKNYGRCWRLLSFYEKSVPEMYNILISNQKYQDALDFATCHGLDKDEVLKSQWLHSRQEINEINMVLSRIKDETFVLSECIDKVGPTESAMKALLTYGLRLTNRYLFSKLEDQESSQVWDFRMIRLQLLQFSDRLETYLGINMGRYSMQEYNKFRIMPLNEAAVVLAESGKIGALNLLFKRHPHSLAPSMLQILSAIPETVPVQTYAQLLPGKFPPTSIVMREEDWVECDKMISFLNRLPENHEICAQIRTEPIIRRCSASFWPSVDELAVWYKNRAREIDTLSGQLDNCLYLVDCACRKGIDQLQQFHEDISYLHQLIYHEQYDGEILFSMGVLAWEQLSNYEKFRAMLERAKEGNVVERLRDKAIPFMESRSSVTQDHDESFLVRWLKEIAMENKLDLCSTVIEEGCRDFDSNCIFRDEAEAVDCALQCIYMCTVTDRWNTMATILSKLPLIQDMDSYVSELKKRQKLAEAHIEAGRLLELYQVPKPLSFFVEAHSDEKGVKQILRLILSKFIRRQPGRSDNDWTSMWRDLQFLREKAFPFVDLEYMLMEFCRGLLKAGKFSLARNYLKGTGPISLPSEKAENLVIQAAREYFFSASSLAAAEIWKAKECLNLFPSSRTVKAEADIIDALTVRLPDLGVTILPVQFRQIKDPMEIIKMAITSQAGAYLQVEELIDVAKLLGLSSFEDISSVQEAIAREAAVAGDMQVASDICLVLAKKGHGPIWDLCAAVARGPELEHIDKHIDIDSRKQLLGFALCHCDEESIGELLHAWKDLDLQGQCETLVMLTGTDPPDFSVKGSSLPGNNIQNIFDLKDRSRLLNVVSKEDQEFYINTIKDTLSIVAKNLPVENRTELESLLKENGKLLSFAAVQLPWLLELGEKDEQGKRLTSCIIPGNQFLSVRAKALATILCWLARTGFAPRDELIASLTKSIIEPPVTEEDDIIGCSFLLNLVDPFKAVEVIEEQLKRRENYHEIRSMMDVGMTFSLLHNHGLECQGSAKRRELLCRNFQEKHSPLISDEINKIDKVHSTFWKEWKLKLEEKMHVTDRTRVLQQIIPGVETERFLSGDVTYIESVVFSLIDSLKSEKKQILKEVLKLADIYKLKRDEVILRYLSSILVSDMWTNEDITADISELKEEILSFASETIKTLSSIVYPEVDGRNKPRLAYIYRLLSECYFHLEESKESLQKVQLGQQVGLAHVYQILEQECNRVSFIENLNFKNITELHVLALHSFSNEVYAHIDGVTMEPLADMVENLVSSLTGPVPEGLISRQDVYKYYMNNMLETLESKTRVDFNSERPEKFQGLISQLEQTYDCCQKYIRLLQPVEALEIIKRHFTAIIPESDSYRNLPDNSTWQDCLILLMNFFIRLTEEMQEFTLYDGNGEDSGLNPEYITSCLKVLMRLVMEDSVSPSQAWTTVISYLSCGLLNDFDVEIFNICQAMMFSGCGFGPISEVFSEAASNFPRLNTVSKIHDLPCLYMKILEPLLQDLKSGSHEDKKLYTLLSSLSSLEGDTEELKRVRHVVWESLAVFSENLQLPSQVRVYALELMQIISGKNVKGSFSELQLHGLRWTGWDELLSTKTETVGNSGSPEADTNRFTSTLVSLKSSQLAAVISPDMEITPDDLTKVETAVLCFSKLCATAETGSHVDALLAILEEWEGFFVGAKGEKSSTEACNAESDWNNDDWDDGWESFQEIEKEITKDSLLVHPLHICWLEIFKKLVTLSRFKDVIRLIDQSLSKSNGALLEEDEVRSLSQILLGTDAFLALKMALLLPYEEVKLQCLNAAEDKLKQGGITDVISQDHELLLQFLCSGILSTIVTDTQYGSIFSYVCFLVGNFSRQFQEAQLLKFTKIKNRDNDFLILFGRILFPCFVSELVKADQEILAGFLVTKFMHTNASLSIINVAEASLSRFLGRQLHLLEHEKFDYEDVGCDMLKNTTLKLRDKLRNLIQSALSELSIDSKK